MATLTISLPNQVAKQLDTEVRKLGCATRSEFFRAITAEIFY